MKINGRLEYRRDEFSNKLKVNGYHLKIPRTHTTHEFFFDGKDTTSIYISKKIHELDVYLLS